MALKAIQNTVSLDCTGKNDSLVVSAAGILQSSDGENDERGEHRRLTRRIITPHSIFEEPSICFACLYFDYPNATIRIS